MATMSHRGHSSSARAVTSIAGGDSRPLSSRPVPPAAAAGAPTVSFARRRDTAINVVRRQMDEEATRQTPPPWADARYMDSPAFAAQFGAGPFTPLPPSGRPPFDPRQAAAAIPTHMMYSPLYSMSGPMAMPASFSMRADGLVMGPVSGPMRGPMGVSMNVPPVSLPWMGAPAGMGMGAHTHGEDADSVETPATQFDPSRHPRGTLIASSSAVAPLSHRGRRKQSRKPSLSSSLGRSTGESWTAAARTAIPMQFDSSVVAGVTQSHQNIAHLQARTKQLIEQDSLRLYREAHATERTRRETREKPWRAACALEAEVNQMPVRPRTSVGDDVDGARVASFAAASEAACAALAQNLSSLLAQHAAQRSERRAERQTRRRREMAARAAAERRVERENAVLHLRADRDADEAAAEAEATMAATQSTTRTDDHGEADIDEFLATSRDPLAQLVRQLDEKAQEDVVWNQIAEKLVAARGTDTQSDETPLLSKPLRQLVQRLHEHHESMVAPLRDLLDRLARKLLQEWRGARLVESVDSIADDGLVQAAAQASASPVSASVPAASASEFGPSAVVDLLDPRIVRAARPTPSTQTTLRIHALQKRHLRRLEDDLRDEFKRSLRAHEDLRETKEGISSRVHKGLFRQTYTEIVRRRAQEIAAGEHENIASIQSSPGVGAGSDPVHSSRHIADYDLATSSLTNVDLRDAHGRVLPKRYVEDDIDHALDDEDPHASRTHYIGAARKKMPARIDNANDINIPGVPFASGSDPHARHMPGMRRFLAGFQHARDLPPGVRSTPPSLISTAFRPSLDVRCNSASDFRALRTDLRTFGVPRLIEERINTGRFVLAQGPDGPRPEVNLMHPENALAMFAGPCLSDMLGPGGDPYAEAADLLLSVGMREAEKEFAVVRMPSIASGPSAWPNTDPVWIGRFEMSARHELLLYRARDWSILNVTTLGMGGRAAHGDRAAMRAELHRALRLLASFESTARTYTSRAGWSGELGLFFHAFPFGPSSALHLHMVDLTATASGFAETQCKNLTLEDVRTVLLEELDALDPQAAQAVREEADRANATAAQGILTRPVLRMHSLENGDVVSGHAAFHSFYYVFRLSDTENGAWLRVIQHPSQSDLHPSDSSASPAATEEEYNFIDVYLNPGAPPTRLRHTHKATTRNTGMCSLDLRTPVDADAANDAADARNMADLHRVSAAPSSLASRSTEWYVRVIGRGLRPKGFTIEFRTNTRVLDYSGVFNQLLADLDEQADWQQNVSDKMVAVDQLLAAFVPQMQTTDATPRLTDGRPVTGLEAMYPNPAERPPVLDAQTQTHVSALHEIDVEASMRRREAEEEAARDEAAARTREERRQVMSLGPMHKLFRHPAPPRASLRIWSQSSLLRLLLQIYKAKLAADDEFERELEQFHIGAAAAVAAAAAGAPPAPVTMPPKKMTFHEFVYNYFVDRYGLVKLAETYVREFLHSIESRYLAVTRVALFSRMLEVLTPTYAPPDVDFFFRALRAVWRWANLHNILATDDDAGHCTLPYYVMEDALFDVFSVANLQTQTKMIANNASLLASNAHVGTGASTDASTVVRATSDREVEMALRAEEVAQTSWCQMLLKKLRPLLVVKESMRAAEPSHGALSTQKPRIERTYLLDADDFLQIMIDHSARSLKRTIEQLRALWTRTCAASTIAVSRRAQQKGAQQGERGATQEQRKSTAASMSRTSDRAGLKLPDFLGFLRVEFPWFDDVEVFLLYFECLKSASLQRSEDTVFLDGFLRVGIRYEMSNPPAPEGSEIDINDDADTTKEKKLVPTSQLHLTTHRLPYPVLVLPGYRMAPKEQDLVGTRASAADAAAKSSGPASRGVKKRAKKAPVSSAAAATGAPPLPYLNTSKLVWDDLALAREVPKPEKRATAAIGSGPSDVLRRPASMLDASIYLPPSMSPPPNLKPAQSIALLTSLFNLLQPMMIDHLNRVQVLWHIPGEYTPEELQSRSSHLSGVYELLSEVQMHLERPGGTGPVIVQEKPRKRTAFEYDDDLYESASGDDEPTGLAAARTTGAAPTKPTAAELDSIAVTSWTLFRRLCALCVDLLLQHSTLYAYLGELQATDGKATGTTQVSYTPM